MQDTCHSLTHRRGVKSVGRSADERQLSRPDSTTTSPLLPTSNSFSLLTVADDGATHDEKDDEVVEEREEEERVVLCSMDGYTKGSDSDRLIVVKGRVGGRTCNHMLTDAGATANFIRRRWAVSRNLPMTPLPKAVTVTLADSSTQLCAMDVVYADTTIRGSVVKNTRLLVLDDLPYDVVVGLPWLDAARVKLEFGHPRRWNGRLLNSDDVLTIREADNSIELLAAMRVRTPNSTVQQLQHDYADVFKVTLPVTTDEQRGDAVHFTIVLKDAMAAPIKQRERRLTPKRLSWIFGMRFRK